LSSFEEYVKNMRMKAKINELEAKNNITKYQRLICVINGFNPRIELI